MSCTIPLKLCTDPSTSLVKAKARSGGPDARLLGGLVLDGPDQDATGGVTLAIVAGADTFDDCGAAAITTLIAAFKDLSGSVLRCEGAENAS